MMHIPRSDSSLHAPAMAGRLALANSVEARMANAINNIGHVRFSAVAGSFGDYSGFRGRRRAKRGDFKQGEQGFKA
jgi:hypothetical protein